MSELFAIFKDYLFQKQETALDVLFLAVVGSLIVAILPKLFKLIVNTINKLRLMLNEMYRKYIKQQMNLNEYIELQERLENGGKLKWYERKGYAEYKLQEQQFQKKNKTSIASLNINKEIKKMYRRKNF